MPKRTFRSWIAFLVLSSLIILTAVAASSVLFTLGNFSDSVKSFSFYIKTNNAEMAKREMANLHYFYYLSRRWRVQWLADKYLFKDAPFYGAADSYNIRDWGRVYQDLKERTDDPQAYPYGNAKFRVAQMMYGQGMKKEAVLLVLTEVAADFEKALRVCLDSGTVYLECYDRVWNYDLATDRKNAEDALKGPKPKAQFILGPPKEKDVDGFPRRPFGEPPGGGDDEKEEAPSGGKRKRP